MGTKSPYETWPPAKRSIRKDGKQKVRVQPRYLTPRMAKCADWLSIASVPPVLAAAGYGATLVDAEAPAVAYGVLATAPALTFLVARFGLYDLLKASQTVVFTPDEIVVEGLFGNAHYDLKLGHKFVLYPHKNAKREEEKITHRARQQKQRWWRLAPKRYFGESWHVALEYMGQRVDLMTVYKRSKAQAICAKLNLCSGGLESAGDVAPDDALTPRADWTPQSGDLPTSSD